MWTAATCSTCAQSSTLPRQAPHKKNLCAVLFLSPGLAALPVVARLKGDRGRTLRNAAPCWCREISEQHVAFCFCFSPASGGLRYLSCHSAFVLLSVFVPSDGVLDGIWICLWLLFVCYCCCCCCFMSSTCHLLHCDLLFATPLSPCRESLVRRRRRPEVGRVLHGSGGHR